MIQLFSSDTCVFCHKIKFYFDSLGVNYEVIDVGESEENYQKLIDVSGQAGIPVTVFDGDTVVIGFDKAKLDQALSELKHQNKKPEPKKDKAEAPEPEKDKAAETKNDKPSEPDDSGSNVDNTDNPTGRDDNGAL